MKENTIKIGAAKKDMFPKVSIGLPVFNGEKYIEKALLSIQKQTFVDLEIIICDNASTDRTGEICLKIAKNDNRIKYFRNELNLGAAANYNKVFKLSKGNYFKWIAHDDICAPKFIEKCVEILESDSSVVLAYPKTIIIDELGNVVGKYEKKLSTDSYDPIDRFSSLLRGHKCFEIFGLIRRNELLKTPLIGGYAHGDGILLSRLALLGRFEEINENLLFAREHGDQSMSMVNDYRSYAVWFNPTLRHKMVFPWWRIQKEMLYSIHQSPLNIFQKYRCVKYLYWDTKGKWKHLMDDVLFHLKGKSSRLFVK